MQGHLFVYRGLVSQPQDLTGLDIPLSKAQRYGSILLIGLGGGFGKYPPKQAITTQQAVYYEKQQKNGDHSGRHWIGKEEQEQAAGGHILGRGNNNIANRFGAGVHCGSGGGFGGVAGEGSAAAQEKGDNLPCGIAAIDYRQREQRAAERPDQGVQTIPNTVEPGDFIGKKFRRRADSGHRNHPWIAKRFEQAQILW